MAHFVQTQFQNMVAICCQHTRLRKYWEGRGGQAGSGKKRDTQSGLMISFVLESRLQNISPVLQEQNVSVS